MTLQVMLIILCILSFGFAMSVLYKIILIAFGPFDK